MTDHTVSPPAAEREPDHVTPGWTTTPAGYQVPNDLDDDPRLWTGEPLGSSYTGPVLDAIRDTVLADVRHFAGLADAYTLCGLERATVRWTDDPATPVDCPQCAGKVVDEQLVKPERRTVSLEVLTDGLRAHLRGVSVGEECVGLVLRINGNVVAVAETDRTWAGPRRTPVDVLAALLRSARTFANDGDPRAELLMPTPDVLAALDGRPDATFWTAPVPVMHRDMQPGWLLISYADEGDSVPAGTERQEPIEAITDCTPELADGVHAAAYATDCRILTVGGQPCHFDNWLTNLVRIPAAVTR